MTDSEASSGVQPRSPKGPAEPEGLTPEGAERSSLAPPKTTFSGDASPARGPARIPGMKRRSTRSKPGVPTFRNDVRQLCLELEAEWQQAVLTKLRAAVGKGETSPDGVPDQAAKPQT